jgi:hypothetical protein
MASSATGTLAATPLAHALVYARNRRLTGRLELATTDHRHAAISLWRGSITAVETQPLGMCPGGFFGAVAYELGFIDSATLDATLLEIAKTKRLHGEILIERKAITVEQRDEALVEQIHRKVHHLFSLPETTTYAFFDAKGPPFDPPVAVDVVGPVWRGVRDYPPMKFVQETMRRAGNNALRAINGGAARLPPFETALTQALAARPMTIDEMKSVTELPPARVELLVYLLVIAKCVESVSGARTHPSTGALPASMPSGPLRAPNAPSSEPRHASGSIAAVRHPSSGAMTAAPSSARVPINSSSRLPPAGGSSPRLPQVGLPSRTPTGSLPPVTRATPSGSTPKLPAQASARPAPPGSLAALKTPAELGLDAIVARAATVEDESYFEVLGVADGASAEAVRAAFLRLAKTWHPDRLTENFLPVRVEVAKIFAHMTRAQKTLCDNAARAAYVAERNAKTAAPPREDVIRDVENALNRRDWHAVTLLCQGLIESDSDDAEAAAVQAWASVRGGDASEDELRAALSRVDRAVNVDRTSDEAIFYRGLIQKRLGNVPSAFRDFARAVQLNPKHVGAERELRILAMRVRKGSGEHKLIAPILEKLSEKK